MRTGLSLVLLVLAVAFASRCGGGEKEPGTPDAGQGSASCPDALPAVFDAGDAACEGHIDCFGGAACHLGVVHWGKTTPVPTACEWEGFEALAAACRGPVAYACSSAACEEVEPYLRYGTCLPRSGSGAQPEHLLRLLCAEGEAKQVGDRCSTDDDCRPAAVGIARLACFDGGCAATARPAAPAGYGGTCGIGPERGMAVSDVLWESPTCPACHVMSHPDAGCLAQACSRSCEYDEDCPEGSICVCANAAGSATGQFCVAQQGARAPERRTEWLHCP